MRIAYLKDRVTVHDARFLEVLMGAGHDPVVGVQAEGGWRLEDGSVVPSGELEDLAIDLVQAGPLGTAGLVATQLKAVPMISVCWGTDGWGLLDAEVARALQESRAVICDCDAIARRLAAAGVPRERLAVFVWGIDLTAFSPPRSPPVDSRWLVSTRVLEPLYRHDVTLKAVRLALDEGEMVTLSLFGDGSARPSLERLARDLRLSEAVTFEQPVPEPELADAFRRATAWVNAARSDGTSISMLQSMACGCGVVTTDAPCAREALRGAVAEFFPVDDHVALARLIGKARRPSPEEASQNVQHLRGFADWTVNSCRYLDVVEGAAR